MITPEQQVAYENAKSLIDELEQLMAAEGNTGEEIAPTVEGALRRAEEDENLDSVEVQEEEEEDDDDEVDKSEDGSTASDDAEEIISEDAPDATDEQLSTLKSISKALLALSKKGKKPVVKKSKENELAKVLKGFASQQAIQGKAIENILEGFGIAANVKKSYSSQGEVKKQLPRQTSSLVHSQMLAQINDNLSKVIQKSDKSKNINECRKDLKSNLSAFFAQ